MLPGKKEYPDFSLEYYNAFHIKIFTASEDTIFTDMEKTAI